MGFQGLECLGHIDKGQTQIFDIQVRFLPRSFSYFSNNSKLLIQFIPSLFRSAVRAHAPHATPGEFDDTPAGQIFVLYFLFPGCIAPLSKLGYLQLRPAYDGKFGPCPCGVIAAFGAGLMSHKTRRSTLLSVHIGMLGRVWYLSWRIPTPTRSNQRVGG